MRSLLFLVLLSLPAALLAQPNCTDLGFTGEQPTPGSSLPQCTQDAQQCCRRGYLISAAARIRNELRSSLQREFGRIVDAYTDDVEDVLDFLQENFIEELVELLPGSQFLNKTSPALLSRILLLEENFDIPVDDDDDDFTTESFITNILAYTNEIVVAALANTTERRQCAQIVATQSLNMAAVNEMARQLQALRRAYSSLQRIGSFLQRQRRELARAEFLDDCINTFIRLSFCRRCTNKTPPLCFNTCNNLLRACYSPYYTSLNRAFSRLWFVARQVVQSGNVSLQNVISAEESIVNVPLLLEQLQERCGITVPGRGDLSREDEDEEEEMNENDEKLDSSSSSSNSSSNSTSKSDSESDYDGGRDIPFGIVDEIFKFTGAFDYGREGLYLCIDALEDDDCMDDEVNFCSGEEICTANCKCFDGKEERPVDNVEPFLLNGIYDQKDNPVLPLDGDIVDMALNNITDPVAAFFATDEFKSVLPEGVETEEDTSAAGKVVASLFVVLLMLLITF